MSSSDLLRSLTDRYPWLNRRRLVIGLLGLAFVIVLAAPGASLSMMLGGIGAWCGLLAATLWGLTFWSKARMQLGGRGLRVRVVRRNARVVALIGVSLVFAKAFSIALRKPSERSGSASGSTAAVSEPRAVETSRPEPSVSHSPTEYSAEAEEYFTEVHKEASEVKQSVSEFDRLSAESASSGIDYKWVLNMSAQFATWQVIYAKASKRLAPPGFEDFNEKYLRSLQMLSAAGQSTASAIDARNPKEIFSAALEVHIAAHKVDAANDELLALQ